MRTRGTLTELRVEDLRCTPAEGAALVAAVGHVPAGTADGLVERTEGWPAGLHLAALTLRGAADPAATAAAISGDERHILDYFTAEVIPGLDPVERDLLVRCSVLERLSGPLCDAVLGVTGSPSVLDRLDRGAVFVSSLGAGWYRCHRLFRDVLRRELDGRLPDAAPDLLARAAGWFLEQGRIEEGVAHLVAAGRDVEALELIRGSGRWFLDHGAMAALLRMGERLAPAVPDPRLYLTLAFAAGLSGQPERAVTWLTAAEPLITDDGEPLTGWRSLRAGAESTWATYGVPGDPAEALRHARRAAELEDDPTLWGYAVVRQSLAGALLGAGQVPEAVEVLREAWRLPARRALPTVLTLQGAGLLALGLVELGHLDEARRVSAEVADLAAATERSWGNGAAAAVAVLRLAEARLVAAVDPAAALPALRRAVEWAQLWGRTTVLVAGLTSLAAAQWATGDATGARTSLERAHEVVGDESVRPLAARQLDELTGRIGRRASTSARQRGALAEELTDREIAVLRALRGPLTAREIGAELRLSINTVKGYTKSLYRKLGVDSRAEAVHRAHDLGLI
jgi:LuxR family maltose regulon positive regulatory protein